MQSEHQDLEDGVVAYVLGAGDEDPAAIRAHLDGCASCRELAGRLSRAVGALPLAADELQPPARLRERILAAAAAAPRPESRSDFVMVPASRRAAPRVLRPRIRGWIPAAAAAVLLLGAGVGAGVGLGRATSPGLAGAHFSLAGSGGLSGASASVVDFRGAGTTLVEFHGLPAPAAGKVYELWLIPAAASSRPVAAGVFTPDPDGSKVLVLARDLGGVKVMAVTVEDGPSGAPQPTQAPELSGLVS